MPRRESPLWGGALFGALAAALLALVALATVSPVAAVAAAGAGVVGFGSLVWGWERTAAALVLVAVLLAPMNSVRPLPGAGVVTASDVFLALGFGILGLLLLGRPLRLPTPLVTGHAIILVIGLVVSLSASEPALSVNFMARLVAGALFLPMLFLWWRPERPLVRALVWAYVLGALVSVVAGVVNGAIDASGRPVGLTTHPNFLGLTSLLAACFTPYLWATARTGLRWLPVIAGLGAVYGVWISGSRAALLVIGLVVVLYPALARSLRAAVGVAVAGAVGLIAFGSVATVDDDSALGRLLGGGGAQASDQEREALFQTAVRSLKNSPVFGGGFADALAAHNVYLQVAVAVGLVGLVGYLLVIYSTVRPALFGSGPDRLLALPAVGYAFIGLLSNILWDRILWVALAIGMLGLLPPITRPARARRAPSTEVLPVPERQAR